MEAEQEHQHNTEDNIMGFFSKIFKGIKKVVKGIGKVVKKVVKSKAFKVIAAVALAVFAPGIAAGVMKGLSTAGAWAAKTIATGAQAAWTAAKAVGTGIKTFGTKVFSSITETISNGVNFMKTKVGLGTPSTLMEGQIAQEKAIAGFFGRETGTTVAKQTLGEKVFGVGGFKSFAKEKGKEIIKGKVLDVVAGKKEEEQSLLQATPTYETRSIGGYDSSRGYQNLADLPTLGMNINSPYLSYSQGQQLFGAPATANIGNV